MRQPMRLYVGGELFDGTSPVKVIEPDRLDWPEELRAEFALEVPWTPASLADHDRLGAKAVSLGNRDIPRPGWNRLRWKAEPRTSRCQPGQRR